MNFRLELASQARKQLDKLPNDDRARIIAALKPLSKSPGQYRPQTTQNIAENVRQLIPKVTVVAARKENLLTLIALPATDRIQFRTTE